MIYRRNLFSRAFFALLFGQLLLTPFADNSALAQSSLKKRIAVLVFEDKTDQGYGWWDRRIHPGEGIADMLVTALVKTDQYVVLERTEIDAILAEQDFGQSGRVTPESAAQIGKLLGVEIAVLGAVTEFGYAKKEVGGATRRLGIGVQSQSAVVAVDVRMVNVESGEILAADNVRKSETKRGLRLDTSRLDFGSRTEFDQSIVGIATRDAIETIVDMIDDTSENVLWQGKVVMASGGTVVINAGEAGGVKVGDRFKIFRPGEELIDPDTGISLGSLESEIGEVEVVNASVGEGKASQCKVVSGEGFDRGDIVREG
jgi:curli biogenesis system outer membrane secretion channel CsgG